jgi:precorrin-6B methylase 2
LVGLALLSRDDAGRYALTPESEAFLVRSSPSFIGGSFRHMSKQVIPSWLHLSEIVGSGKPVRTRGMNDAQFFAEFVEDIMPLSYPPARILAGALGIAQTTKPVSVLDLGSGSGVWGIALAQASSHVSVRAIDMPDVLPVTKRITERFGVAKQFTMVAGDLLEADFGDGHQVATLGHILHSEGVERSRALLERVHAALAPGGTIAIAEFLVNADRRGPLGGLIFAVNMLNTEAGGTYSFEEIAAWLTEAGFVNPRPLPAATHSPLILATRG